MSSLAESAFSVVMLVCTLLLSSVGTCGCLKKLRNIFKRKKHWPPPRDLSKRLPPTNNRNNQQLQLAPELACRAAPSTNAEGASDIQMPSAQQKYADDTGATNPVSHDQSQLENENDDGDQPPEPVDGDEEGNSAEGEHAVKKNDESDSADQQEEGREEKQSSLAPVEPSQSTFPVGYRHKTKIDALEVIGTAIVDRFAEHQYNKLMLKAEQDRRNYRIPPNIAMVHLTPKHDDVRERERGEHDVEYLNPRSLALSRAIRKYDDNSLSRMTTLKHDGGETESSTESAPKKENDVEHKKKPLNAGKKHPMKEPILSGKTPPKKEKKTSEMQKQLKNPIAKPKEASPKKITQVANRSAKSEKQKQPKQPTAAPKKAPQESRTTIPGRSTKKYPKQAPSEQKSNTGGKTQAPPLTKLPKTNKPKPVSSSKIKKSPKPIMKKAQNAPNVKAKPTTSPHGVSKVNEAASKINRGEGLKSSHGGGHGGKKHGGGKQHGTGRR